MNENLPLLARQPIFDANMNVVAYELLCRDTNENRAIFDDADQASSQVILRAFTDLSIEDVIGKHKAFINFTRKLLDTSPPFSRQQLVIEVLENIKVDDALIARLRQLRAEGYVIALDDFVLNHETMALLDHADIVKLDVLALSEGQLREYIAFLKGYENLTLLAEKVETYEMLETCKNMGFNLFQGFFLSRPKLITGRRVSENRQAIMQLLASLNDPNTEVEEIEKLISHDPVLSYKLLKLINSAAFNLVNKIESLRQAITLLGLLQIRSWVTLLAMSNISNKPQELAVTSMTRARFCQLLGQKINGQKRADTHFTVGLLSTLDAFMDEPLKDLLDKISLSSNLVDALLRFEGDEGKILNTAMRYERGDWDGLEWDYLNERGVVASDLAGMYTESLSWTNAALDSLTIND
jgi:EAL and modified HD-GYP domain-containing signal transduction protein